MINFTKFCQHMVKIIQKLFVPNESELKNLDVLFIGNRYGIRGKIVEFLMKNNINVT